jgi:hypothetical protein
MYSSIPFMNIYWKFLTHNSMWQLQSPNTKKIMIVTPKVVTMYMGLHFTIYGLNFGV